MVTHRFSAVFCSFVALLVSVHSTAFGASPSGAPVAAKPANPVSATKATDLDFSMYYRSFVVQRGLAAKGEVCIRTASCVSDESDYLRHAENAYKIQKGIEAHAAAGNHNAAYYAGLIAFEEAKRFDEEFHIYASFKDERYLEAGRRFLESSDREIKRAKKLLYPAAYAMHPDACMLMGEVLEYDRLGDHKTSALTYYYCASREYFRAGNRDLAFKAYSGMLRTGPHQDPMVIEMHAKLLDKQPVNPWRTLTPETRAKGLPVAPNARAGSKNGHD